MCAVSPEGSALTDREYFWALLWSLLIDLMQYEIFSSPNAKSWLIRARTVGSCCVWAEPERLPDRINTSIMSAREESPCFAPETEQREDFTQHKTRIKLIVSPSRFPPDLPHFSLSSWCYRCHCPPQLEGPDCQQMRLSFLGNGYAWFPPIRPCFDSHLSLEFMTEEEDGLLLYTGPLATLLPGDAEDYMAIGKEWGQIMSRTRRGACKLFLVWNQKLNSLFNYCESAYQIEE